MKLAKTAPIPRVTNKTGKAQQTSVPKLANKLKNGAIVCLYILFFPINFHHVIPRISDKINNHFIF